MEDEDVPSWRDSDDDSADEEMELDDMIMNYWEELDSLTNGQHYLLGYYTIFKDEEGKLENTSLDYERFLRDVFPKEKVDDDFEAGSMYLSLLELETDRIAMSRSKVVFRKAYYKMRMVNPKDELFNLVKVRGKRINIPNEKNLRAYLEIGSSSQGKYSHIDLEDLLLSSAKVIEDLISCREKT